MISYHLLCVDSIKSRYTRDISKKQVNAVLESDQKKATMSRGQSQFLSQLEQRNETEFLSSSNGTRSKRQTFGRRALCEVNTQFVMPQAALNNKGNWMYVINQNDVSRQLVKTETCA